MSERDEAYVIDNESSGHIWLFARLTEMFAGLGPFITVSVHVTDDLDERDQD